MAGVNRACCCCCCCCAEDENDDVDDDDGGGSGECRGFGDRDDDGGMSVRRSKCDNNFSTCSAPR